MPSQPESLHVNLLGGFAVAHGQQRVPASAWRLRTAAMLVKALALAPGHRLHRDQIMDLFWPESDPEAALNSLRYTLYTARKTLAASGLPADRILTREGESLVLGQGDSVITDVAQFEAATTCAWQTKQSKDFQTAAELYRGELLPEDRYEDWVDERRNALRMSYLTLLGRLASCQEVDGDLSASIATLQQILALEPADELTHARLMRLYGLTGQRRQALTQYERLRDLLESEFAAVPEETTRNLALAIQSGDFPAPEDVAAFDNRLPANTPVSFAPVQSAAPTNVPAPLSSLIGRERELAEVVQFLNAHRLVTLTGTGGIGKTRLAVEVGRAITGQFPDGVFWVELAPLRDPGLVLSTIANTLGVQTDPDRPLLNAVVAWLKEKTILLLLDNFEHLVDAAPVVTTLLTSSPSLRVLATSRVRLRLRGEQQYPVSPLELPERESLNAGELIQYSAVQLFAERAREVDPRFQLIDDTAPDAATICRRLDGLPLAIELAAARVEQMSLKKLLLHLERRLQVLVDGPRDLSDRQQTLRDTIGWSYELLSVEDQRLFPMLAVFAGGWSVEAAIAVACMSEEHVCSTLDRLAEHHLIIRTSLSDGMNRYSMLETIREYGIEQLEASGEAHEAYERHAGYILAFAQQAAPELLGNEQLIWLDRLNSEQENLRLALRWSIDHDLETAAGLVGASLDFWQGRSNWDEGRLWANQLLAVVDGASLRAQVTARWVAANMARSQSDHAAAEPLLMQCLPLLEQLDDSIMLAWVLNSLGIIATELNNLTRAQECMTQSIALFEKNDHQIGVSAVLNNLGCLMHGSGDFGQAEMYLERSMEIDRRRGDTHGTARASVNLAYSLLALENTSRASALFRRALMPLHSFGDLVAEVECLDGLAGVAAAQGDPVRSARLLGAAEALRASENMSRELWRNTDYHRIVESTRAQITEVDWQAAWTEGAALGLDEVLAEALRET